MWRKCVSLKIELNTNRFYFIFSNEFVFSKNNEWVNFNFNTIYEFLYYEFPASSRSALFFVLFRVREMRMVFTLRWNSTLRGCKFLLFKLDISNGSSYYEVFFVLKKFHSWCAGSRIIFRRCKIILGTRCLKLVKHGEQKKKKIGKRIAGKARYCESMESCMEN